MGAYEATDTQSCFPGVDGSLCPRRLRLWLAVFPGGAHLVEAVHHGDHRGGMCPTSVPLGRSHRGHAWKLWALGPGHARHHPVSYFDVACDVGAAAALAFKIPGLRAGYPFNTSSIVEPSAAGLSDTCTPAARSASCFAAAVSRPPLMTAPAWPMRRPGGALVPAINPTVGFFTELCARKSAASASLWPPISPIMTICFVSGSARNISKTSIKSRPFTGSPPIPTHELWPSPTAVVCATAS